MQSFSLRTAAALLYVIMDIVCAIINSGNDNSDSSAICRGGSHD